MTPIKCMFGLHSFAPVQVQIYKKQGAKNGEPSNLYVCSKKCLRCNKVVYYLPLMLDGMPDNVVPESADDDFVKAVKKVL